MKIKKLAVTLFLAVLCAGCSVAPKNGGFASAQDSSMEEQNKKGQDIEDDAYDSFDRVTKSVYYDTIDKILDGPDDGIDVPLKELIFRGGIQVYTTVRSLAPAIFVFSIGIGILIFMAARHNKGLRKIGLYGFIIGIPLFLIFLIYGIGILYDMFLF